MKKIKIYLQIFLFLIASTLQAEILLENLAAKKNLVAVAVIGSGSAGFGASFVTSSEKYHTVVFQGEKLRGGLDYEKPVKNWLGAPLTPGKEIMQRLEDQAQAKGAIIVQDPVISVDFSVYPYRLKTQSETIVHALSVIIATGTSHSLLAVDGSDAYADRGILYDVAKHDPTWHGKRIVVIGSGDDAISKAARLAANAETVTICARSDHFKGDKDVEHALFQQNPHVHALFNTEITKISGNGAKITHVTVHSDKKSYELETDIVVVAIGRKPNSAIFNEYLVLDDSDSIVVTPFTQQTSLEGVFAAGNVAAHSYGQAFISCSDGMKAGYDAAKYLQKNGFTNEIQEKISASLYTPPQEHMHAS